MFNSFPAVFKSEEMANKAARAFSGETGDDWMVLCKIDDFEFTRHYKPCMVRDYDNDVKRDGWFIAT